MLRWGASSVAREPRQVARRGELASVTSDHLAEPVGTSGPELLSASDARLRCGSGAMLTACRSNGENAALMAAPGAAAAAQRWRYRRTPPLHSPLRSLFSLFAPISLLLLLHLGCVGAAGDNIGDWSPLEAGHGNWSAKQLKKNTKKLKSHDAVMVGFSGASCGDFCRQFEPVYAEFTSFLSAELPAIKFIRFDADKHKAVMAQYAAIPKIPCVYARIAQSPDSKMLRLEQVRREHAARDHHDQEGAQELRRVRGCA